MIITLTPEIEQALNEIAEKQGTTIEVLVLNTLREKLFTPTAKPNRKISQKLQRAKTLADFLAGYVGVLDSNEFTQGGAQMSKNTGKKFAEILIEKRRQGKL